MSIVHNAIFQENLFSPNHVKSCVTKPNSKSLAKNFFRGLKLWGKSILAFKPDNFNRIRRKISLANFINLQLRVKAFSVNIILWHQVFHTLKSKAIHNSFKTDNLELVISVSLNRNTNEWSRRKNQKKIIHGASFKEIYSSNHSCAINSK